jgi:phosphate-selective porin OprO/OprP
VATTLLANQLSPGQQSIFGYRADGSAAGTALADGQRQRLAPQLWLYRGPLGVLAEWTRSSQRVRRGAATAALGLEAWQLQVSWVLTREDNAFRGVAPRVVFDPRGNRRGAWIVALRASGLDADEAAFPLFADPARAARSALTLGASVSWNFSRGVRWVVDYNATSFDGGAATGDRPTEQAMFTRFQISF